MTDRLTTLILGEGRGNAFFPLTSYRSTRGPIGGQYRLVDIPISNAINSGFGAFYPDPIQFRVAAPAHPRRILTRPLRKPAWNF